MGDLEPDEVREWEGEAVDDEKVLSGLMAATMHTAETKFNPGKKNQKREHCDPGLLNDIAAMMLMTILYSARVARYDLLKAVAFLAKRITRWDAKCDRRLHRLMCYIYTTWDHIMVGWVGDAPRDISACIFCDDDFA